MGLFPRHLQSFAQPVVEPVAAAASVAVAVAGADEAALVVADAVLLVVVTALAVAVSAAAEVAGIAPVSEPEYESVVASASELAPSAAFSLFSFLYYERVVAAFVLMSMHHYILETTLQNDTVIPPDVWPFVVTFSASLVAHSAFFVSTNGHCFFPIIE